jgi:hypothetical protein
MKHGRDYPDFVAELERQAATKEDFVVNQEAIVYEPHEGNHGSIHFQDSGDRPSYKITSQASKQLATKLGIPQKYYERMEKEQPHLLGKNVNTWLTSDPGKRTMIRILDGQTRAFLSDRYNRIDNYDVFKTVAPIFKEMAANNNLTFASAELTERRMYFKVLFPQIQGDLEVGDPVQAGMIIANSETGFGVFEMSPLLFRLRCKNGLKSSDRLTRRHVGSHVTADENGVAFRDETRKADDKALMMKIEDTLRHVIDETAFNHTLVTFRETKEISFKGSNPAAIVEKLANSYNLSQSEQEGVLTSLFDSGDGLTGFGLINAVTAYSQIIEDYDRASELEGLGGKLLDLKPAEWMQLAA